MLQRAFPFLWGTGGMGVSFVYAMPAYPYNNLPPRLLPTPTPTSYPHPSPPP